VRQRFRRKPRPRKDALRYVGNCGYWGNAITVDPVGDNLSVSGHLSHADFPQEGDVLVVPMESGRWGEYVFTRVKRCYDPKDMFVGEAAPLDYTEDVPKGERPDELIPKEHRSVFSRG
jgi:hypothetical protein